jgi:hypothetical protein
MAACASASTPRAGINEYVITASTRPASYRTCPSIAYEPTPPLQLIDRELPNLGAGLFGHRDTYEHPPQKLEVLVGVDVLDAYEDLDFEAQTQVVGGTEITISAAGAFGTDDRLLVLTWRDQTDAEPCARRAVVGTNIDLAVLLDAAREMLSAT